MKDSFNDKPEEQQIASPPSGNPVYAADDVPGARFSYARSSEGVHSPKPERPRGKGYIVAIVAIVAVCLVLLTLIASCSSTMSQLVGASGFGQAESEQQDGSPKIGVISIDGAIQYDGTACSPSGLRTLLKQAEDRSDIKAVVLRVNSGGGTATAGEEMAHYVAEFSKPVVVSSASTNASAAYEISSQADCIYVANTTAIGSIGVAMQVTDLSGLYRMLGINIENITSSESKDSTYGYRPLSKSERAWYQRMVDQINDDFIAEVAKGRKMDLEEVRKLANGLTYTGIDAVENGLADEVGYLEDATSKASELAGFGEVLETVNLKLKSPTSLSAILELIGNSSVSDEVALDALVRKYGTYQSME